MAAVQVLTPVQGFHKSAGGGGCTYTKTGGEGEGGQGVCALYICIYGYIENQEWVGCLLYVLR